MMHKLDNPQDNEDVIDFLRKLDNILKKIISQEDYLYINQFCQNGYFNKIVTRVMQLEKIVKIPLEKKIKELQKK